MAATVRVGHAVGRDDAGGVKRAGLVALLLGVALTAIFTLMVIVSRFAIGRFFFGIADGADASVALTANLLLIGATFFIGDGVQSIASGALRGMNDTRVPLLFAAISYWLVGFTLAAALGFRTGLGAIGVWIGLSCGTAIYATLLVLRFRRLARRFGAP
jgi:MATE family multidrug resistance protein